MKICCATCGSASVQKIDVLLATGTTETVTKTDIPKDFFGRGYEASSVTESSLAKLVRNKLSSFDNADKHELSKYEERIREREEKGQKAGELAANQIHAPDLIKSEKNTKIISLLATIAGAGYSIAIGSGIFGILLYSAGFGVCGFLLVCLYYDFLIRFINPDLRKKIDEQHESRLKAVDSALESARSEGLQNISPNLRGRKLRSSGYFCHTCGNLFVPDENNINTQSK